MSRPQVFSQRGLTYSMTACIMRPRRPTTCLLVAKSGDITCSPSPQFHFRQTARVPRNKSAGAHNCCARCGIGWDRTCPVRPTKSSLTTAPCLARRFCVNEKCWAPGSLILVELREAELCHKACLYSSLSRHPSMKFKTVVCQPRKGNNKAIIG